MACNAAVESRTPSLAPGAIFRSVSALLLVSPEPTESLGEGREADMLDVFGEALRDHQSIIQHARQKRHLPPTVPQTASLPHNTLGHDLMG